ncbi:inositol 1,4,5-trisphosphate receptor-interacting protein-like 1 [Grus japonensis]|uniref:Inositol 1,4,5-trisphosphate receptor-interacting protein-like 1 n=1 Tax=Grus japonensis TaxID=30415 RepID=A0ABC9X083_GRUJA
MGVAHWQFWAVAGVLVVLLGLCWWLRKRSREADSSRDEETSNSIRDQEEEDELEQEEGQEEEESEGEDPDDEIDLGRIFAKSIQWPVQNLAYRSRVVEELVGDLFLLFKDLFPNSFFPVLQPAIGVGSTFEGWCPHEDDAVYRVLVPLKAPRGHAFHLELGTTGDRPAKDSCIRVELERTCTKEQLVDNMLCFLHHSEEELKRNQGPSLLHTLCTGSYLDVEKTVRCFQKCVRLAWVVLPQSQHYHMKVLPSSRSCKLQLTSASRRTLFVEVIFGVQQGDSDIFLSSQATEAIFTPNTTWPETYAVAEVKLFSYIARQAPRDSFHLKCLQLCARILVGTGFSTYTFKTAMMHLLISVPLSSWCRRDFLLRLEDIMQYLRCCLKEKRLDHFFFGNENMPKEILLPPAFRMAEPFDLFQHLAQYPATHAKALLAGVLVVLLGLCWWLRKRSREADSSRDEETSNSIRDQEEEDELEQEEGQEEEESEGEDPDDEIDLGRIFAKSIQWPVQNLAYRSRVVEELVGDLFLLFKDLFPNSFFPVLQPAIGVGSTFEGWCPHEDDAVYRVLVPLKAPRGHAFHLELGTTGDRPAKDSCIRVELERTCTKEQLVDNMLCFLHHSEEELKRNQGPSLLHTLCTGSYLDVEKTVRCFQKCVRLAWVVLPQSQHYHMKVLPSSRSCKLQLTSASRRTLFVEVIFGVQQGDSDIFLSSQATEAIFTPNTTWPETYAVAEVKLFSYIARQAPRDSFHLKCLQLCARILVGTGFSTYTFKTAMMHLLISVPLSSWCRRDFLLRLEDIMQYLRCCLKEKRLDHFFFGNENMPKEILLPPAFRMAEPFDLFQHLAQYPATHAKALLAGVLVVLLGLCWWLRKRSREADSSRDEETSNSIRDQEEEDELEQEEGQEEEESEGEDPDDEIDLGRIFAKSIQWPVQNLAYRSRVVEELVGDLFLLFKDLFPNSFFPVLQPAIGVGSTFEGWCPHEDDAVYRVLVPLKAPRGHAFHLELGTTGDRPAKDSCIRVELERTCTKEQLVDNMLCFLHHSEEELKRNQGPSLLHTLCTGSYLDVEKTVRCFQKCVRLAWVVLPQSQHYHMKVLPSSRSCKLQLTSASRRTLFVEVIFGVQQGDSDIFLSSQATEAIFTPNTTWPETYAVAEVKLFSYIARQAPRDSFHLKCLQLCARILVGTGFSTYTFKTAMMHLLISVPLSSWCRRDFLLRLEDIMQYLRCCLKEKRLDHFFFGNENMPKEILLPPAFKTAEPFDLFQHLAQYPATHAKALHESVELQKRLTRLVFCGH